MGSASDGAGKCCTNCGDIERLSATDWESRYQEGRTGWDRGESNPTLSYWCDAVLQQPQSILIPGCGRGYEVIELASRGHRVTGIDFADSAIAAARRQAATLGVEPRLLQEDLFAHTPSEPYDAIYEQTCLCAIHPSQWATYEQLLFAWLKPSGKLLAHFMQSEKPDGPPFHCELSSMKFLFPETRWVWHSIGERRGHPMGMDEIPCLLERRREAAV